MVNAPGVIRHHPNFVLIEPSLWTDRESARRMPSISMGTTHRSAFPNARSDVANGRSAPGLPRPNGLVTGHVAAFASVNREGTGAESVGVGSIVDNGVVALASVFAYASSTLGTFDHLAKTLVGTGTSEVVVLLGITLLLLIAGMFLDAISIYFIFLPLLVPVALMTVVPSETLSKRLYTASAVAWALALYGLMAATPKAIIDQIAADVRAAVLSPDLSRRFREMGMEATGVASERFGEIVRRDY